LKEFDLSNFQQIICRYLSRSALLKFYLDDTSSESLYTWVYHVIAHLFAFTIAAA